MVDEGFSILPATAVPTSGLDLAKLANGRVLEARVASLADGIAIVSSRHGSLQVDLAAFGRRLPAVGDTVRLQVQAVEGGGRPTVTVVDDAAAVPSAMRVEDAVAVLARELRGAAASQTGLAPLYATLAGLARAPAGAVPDAVRSLVTQIMGNRLGDGGPPDAAAVRKAFRGSGLFLETRLAAAPGSRTGAGEDLKAALFSLRAALEKWVGGPGTSAATGEVRSKPIATGAAARLGGEAPPTGAAGGSETAGTMRPDAAAMRNAGAAYAGLASRVGGRGAGFAGEVAGAPGTMPARPAVDLGAACPAAPGATIVSVPTTPTGAAPSLAGVAPSTPATGEGPALPAAASGPVGAAAPSGISAAAAVPVGETGVTVAVATASAAAGAGSSPPSAPAIVAAVPPSLAAAGPAVSGVPVDPLVAATAPTGPGPSARVALGMLPGGGPVTVSSVGVALPGVMPTGDGAPGLGDGDRPIAAGAAAIAPVPGANAALAAAAGRDDGIAVLLAAVVKGLEAAGSLTASRPSEMGEAAAALAAIGPERDLRPPPPRRGQAPRGQAALSAETIGEDGVEGLGRQALERTEGALSRIVLEQFAALDRRNDDGTPGVEARATREWMVEMPIATADGTGVVQMTVERDGGRARSVDAARTGWRVRFSMDVEPLGPIHAQIGLSGEKLAIGLWAERPDAAARLGGDVGRLQGALEAAAIPVESIHLATGRPSTGGPSPTAGRFVDVKL